MIDRGELALYAAVIVTAAAAMLIVL